MHSFTASHIESDCDLDPALQKQTKLNQMKNQTSNLGVEMAKQNMMHDFHNRSSVLCVA